MISENSRTVAILSWMRQHKLAAGILSVVIVVILIIAFVSTLYFGASGNYSKSSSESFDAYSSAVQEMNYRTADVDTAGYDATGESGQAQDASGVLIREGSVQIDSENTAADEAEIRILTDSYDGYIEEGSQSESNTRRRTHLTARVPADSFAEYLADIRAQFDVEDYSIRDYRIEIEEQITELDIIADSAAKYAAMKEEVQQMAVDAERINLTMEITEKELELKRQENRLAQQIDRVTRRGDMATLRITLEERVSAEIWPEDIGNDIIDSIRSAIDSVVGITIAIFTTSIVVFMTTMQWAVYLLIILVVLWFAYRLLRRLYNRWKK